MPTAYGYGPIAPRGLQFSSVMPPIAIMGPNRRAHGSNVLVMYAPQSVDPTYTHRWPTKGRMLTSSFTVCT
eukprot:5737911-Prymnesium_polylepis.2